MKARVRRPPGLAVGLSLLIVATGLLFWGARYAALLLLGQPRQAVIQYSVRQYGASRGTFYNVHYISDVPGEGRYSGTATARGSYPPADSLHVRYLRACPDISHPGTNAVLGFYALLWIFPGTLLALAGVRLLPSGWM